MLRALDFQILIRRYLVRNVILPVRLRHMRVKTDIQRPRIKKQKNQGDQ